MSDLPPNTLQTHVNEADIRHGLEFVVRDPEDVQLGTRIVVNMAESATGDLNIVSEEESGKIWLGEWKGPDGSQHNDQIFRLIVLEDKESEERGYHRLRKFEVELVGDHELQTPESSS